MKKAVKLNSMLFFGGFVSVEREPFEIEEAIIL
jgi:hypothetical protein